MRKKIERFPSRLARAVAHISPEAIQKPFDLKNHSGLVCPQIRITIRELACQGVANERIFPVILAVARGLGVPIIGSFSARTVSRVMAEALIQARMQIGDELNKVTYFSICGDGTSIKNQQHESKSLFLPLHTSEHEQHAPTPIDVSIPPVLRSLGVQKASNHTAKLQLQGWISAIEACCNLFTRSPLGQGVLLNSQIIAGKLRGFLSDHASDQMKLFELLCEWKRHCDCEIRGYAVLEAMSKDDQLQALSAHLEQACNNITGWDSLGSENQGTLLHDAWRILAVQRGELEFNELDQTVQDDVSFFGRTGCCMHKELNAVKGGASAMAAAWKSLGTSAPIALQNKFEASKPSYSSLDNAPRGAIKLTSLAGAIFNHRDDKKGYQVTIDNFFESTLGFSNRFPDTSNTRYGSHCDAAIELLVHLDKYIELLQLLHDAKSIPGFTNIELNLFRGLQDNATLTELAVLGLYALAVGRPYMAHVRGVRQNAFELGEFHNQVKNHCRAIIETPDLLLACDATASSGALEGEVWDRPDFIYCIISISSRTPYLRPLLVAFFEGALKTWERFTAEFAPEGTIARATPEQRASAWVSPTNDVSEGALGRCRQVLRHKPTMTDNQRIARSMYRDNDTQTWAAKSLTEADNLFIRQEARKMDSSGAARAIRLELCEAIKEKATANRVKQAKAAEKKATNEQKLASIELLLESSEGDLMKLTVPLLDQQIDKLREFDREIRAKSTIRNKKSKSRGGASRV
ncbi:hypothetical protein BDV93DRAFT_445204 [Ceratobasidium sp. AG-I]|nr:hypothetical protein BDV93DRAFT_445204 [Ceratobasidium sp. AG-I]